MFDLLAALVLFAAAAAAALLLDCPVEKALPLCTMAVTLIIYLFGLADHMEIGFYLVLACIAVLCIFSVRSIKRWKKENLLTAGAGLYWATVILALIQHCPYTIVNTWDEIGQWALTARYSYMTNWFGAHAGSNCIYLDYPPASAVFHYFWLKIGRGFVDYRLYISMAVLFISFLAPLAAGLVRKKRPLWNVLVCAALYLAPMVFCYYAYKSLMVDCLMGLCFGYGLLSLVYESDERIQFLGLSLVEAQLVLLKESGMIFAMILLAAALARRLCMAGQKKRYTVLRACLLPASMAAFSLFGKASWMWYLQKEQVSRIWGGYKTPFQHLSSFENLKEYWLGLPAYYRQGFINYFRALFNYKAIEDTSQTTFYMGPFSVSAIWWILLLAALVVLLLCQRRQSLADKMTYAIVLLGFLIYICSVALLYMTSFGEGEVAILSSFSRYQGTYYIAVYLLVFYSLLSQTMDTKKKLAWVLLAAMLFMPHITRDYTFLGTFDPDTYNQKQNLYEQRQEYIDYILELREHESDAEIKEKEGQWSAANYILTPANH